VSRELIILRPPCLAEKVLKKILKQKDFHKNENPHQNVKLSGCSKVVAPLNASAKTSWLAANNMLARNNHGLTGTGDLTELNVAQLQDILKDVDQSVSEARACLTKLESQSRHIQEALLKRIDADPLEVLTPQASVYATPEGRQRLLTMTEVELRDFFFDYTAGVSVGQKHEVYCYCRRVFRDVPAPVVERALQANRNHLAGAYLMLEAWLGAGKPERLSWKPLGAATHGRFRMAWPYESYRQHVGEAGRHGNNPDDLIKPLSTPMLLELQFIHVLKEWRALNGCREKMFASKSTSTATGGDRSSFVSQKPWTPTGRMTKTAKSSSLNYPPLAPIDKGKCNQGFYVVAGMMPGSMGQRTTYHPSTRTFRKSSGIPKPVSNTKGGAKANELECASATNIERTEIPPASPLENDEGHTTSTWAKTIVDDLLKNV
jgi:hypothetical protein